MLDEMDSDVDFLIASRVHGNTNKKAQPKKPAANANEQKKPSKQLGASKGVAAARGKISEIDSSIDFYGVNPAGAHSNNNSFSANQPFDSKKSRISYSQQMNKDLD